MHRHDHPALPALDDDVRAPLTNDHAVVLVAGQELQESSWRHPPSLLDRSARSNHLPRRADPAVQGHLRVAFGSRVMGAPGLPLAVR